MKKVFLFLPLFLLFIGCDPDFGDKIYRWIERNARNYSEQLTHKDLRVRWMKTYTEHYKTISFHSDIVETRLNDLYKSTTNNESYLDNSLGSFLVRYDHSKSTLQKLISVKETIERNDTLFQSLSNIGNLSQFEAAGLQAIGKETLLRSFLEIGDQQSTINKLRYQKLFSLKYSIAIDENGNLSQRVDQTQLNSEYSYSGRPEEFLYDIPVIGSIFSFLREDDIEEQVDRIKEALDRYDELCLTPREQYEISRNYVQKAKDKYAEHHTLADSIHQLQKDKWLKLFQWNVARFKQAETAIQPFKVQLANDQFQGSEEIQRIVSEESRFRLREEMIEMMDYVRHRSIEAQMENDRFTKIEKLETFKNSIEEAKFVLNILKDRKKLISLYGEIDAYLQRLKKDSLTAAQINSNLLNQ